MEVRKLSWLEVGRIGMAQAIPAVEFVFAATDRTANELIELNRRELNRREFITQFRLAAGVDQIASHPLDCQRNAPARHRSTAGANIYNVRSSRRNRKPGL